MLKHLRPLAIGLPATRILPGCAAPPGWQALRLTFATFPPHPIDRPRDRPGLRPPGLVAVGREMRVDLRLARPSRHS